jgi:hypothetical protein
MTTNSACNLPGQTSVGCLVDAARDVGGVCCVYNRNVGWPLHHVQRVQCARGGMYMGDAGHLLSKTAGPESARWEDSPSGSPGV